MYEHRIDYDALFNGSFVFSQNEGMTGVLTFGPVFSRLTFAALEDSG